MVASCAPASHSRLRACCCACSCTQPPATHLRTSCAPAFPISVAGEKSRLEVHVHAYDLYSTGISYYELVL